MSVTQLEVTFTQAGEMDGTAENRLLPSFTRVQFVRTIHKYITAKAKVT